MTPDDFWRWLYVVSGITSTLMAIRIVVKGVYLWL